MKYTQKFFIVLCTLTYSPILHAAAAAQNPLADYVRQVHAQIPVWNSTISASQTTPQNLQTIINDIQSRITILTDMVTNPQNYSTPTTGSYTLLRTFENVQRATDVVFSPDEKYMMTVQGNKAQIHNPQIGASMHTISFDPPQSKNPHPIEMAALTNEYIILAAKTTENAVIKKWNINGTFVKAQNVSRDANLQLSQLSANKNEIILVIQRGFQSLNIKDFEPSPLFDTLLGKINSVTLSPNPKNTLDTYLAATTPYGNAQIWNIKRKQLIIERHETNKDPISFNVDGTQCCIVQEDRTAYTRNEPTYTAYIYYTAYEGLVKNSKERTIKKAVFSPTQAHEVMINDGANIAIWDITKDTYREIPTAPEFKQAFWSPRGTEIIITSRAGVQLLNAQTGQVMQTISDIDYNKITRITFSQQGTYMAISYESKLLPGAPDKSIDTRLYKIAP